MVGRPTPNRHRHAESIRVEHTLDRIGHEGNQPMHELAGNPIDERNLAKESNAPVLETGTTTVAVTAGDAVVLAADQRASLGGQFTANKAVRKVQEVHPRGALALSGSVGPVQDVVRTLDAEASLYAARRGEELSIGALATVAGSLLRGVPAQVLLGGVDADGPAVYEIDGGGGVVPTTYGAAGSGMQVAYGVLEGAGDAVKTPEAGRELARSAIATASERDTASGNGAHVATITDDGVELSTLDRDAVNVGTGDTPGVDAGENGGEDT
jgi:proteasome beta subunit